MNSTQYKPLPYPQTPMSARDYFYSNGITIVGWARAMELSVVAVRGVIYGQSTGRSGQSHRAAVALGLKPNPDE